jgi:hypothetical protein
MDQANRRLDEPAREESKVWMWASGHNGDIRRAAHEYEPTREAAIAVFARSWRPGNCCS